MGRGGRSVDPARLVALALLAAAALTAAGCAGARSLLPGPPESPRDRYAARLAGVGLDTAALARDWIAAGEQSLSAAHDTVLPFRETGYIDAARPGAVAYKMALRRGRVLVVDVTFETVEPGRLFVDLFLDDPDADPAPSRVASLADDETALRFEVKRDGTYLLRIQPELLRGGRYSLVNRTEASLRTFPVEGLTPRAAQSGFGDPRDAGGREHQGIDIFARRGTPVVAVVGGVASSSTNNLGGNVVWLNEGAFGRRFYYAHLERPASETTRRVAAGEVIGYVGNTGNARTTAPHLHFGIYSPRPVDPAPFLASDDAIPPAVGVSPELIGAWARVSRVPAALNAGPHAAAARRSALESDAVVRVEGASLRAYRVVLPYGTTGYIAAANLVAADRNPRRVRTTAPARLRDAPDVTAPAVIELERGVTVDVLGRAGAFRLVRLDDGRMGWLAEGIS